MLIDEEIDRETRKTIKYLINEHHIKYGVNPADVRVIKKAMEMNCPSCRHRCEHLSYIASGSHIDVITYESCDCGYTLIMNWGGMLLERYPGAKPMISNGAGNGTHYVTDSQFAAILHTKLVTAEG